MTNGVSFGAVDFGYVEAARRRVEDMRRRGEIVLDPPTADELEAALGDRVQRSERLAENWRNRVYRIELARSGAVLAKQVVMATAEMLQYQFEELHLLSNLQIPGLHIPKPLALLPAQRVLLMEFATGRPIPSLVWQPRAQEDLLVACKLAGEILARLQVGWTRQISPLPVDALEKDLVAAPWRLSAREKKILRSTLDRLRDVQIPVGKVYYDYKAANLLFENGELSLVDPPDRKREGAQMWDFSCFRSSMRHHLWRFKLRRPFDQRAGLIRQGISVFEGSYLQKAGETALKPKPFALTALLFELQRTAVAMTMQQGKVEIAAQERADARGKGLGGGWANRITLPLLRMEKRWLFGQLARELS